MAASEVSFSEVFDTMDKDGSGSLSQHELQLALEKMGLPVSQVKSILEASDRDKNGDISKTEFMMALKTTHTNLSMLVKKTKDDMQSVKMEGGGVHAYSLEEVAAFSDHLNNVLGDVPQIQYMMPIDSSDPEDLFRKCGDGVLLALFINCIAPDTIDTRVLNLPKKNKKMTIFKINENLNLAINACKGIGIKVLNIGGGDIREVKNPSLILGLMWQMVKMHLLSDINLKDHPELMRLLEEGETLQDLLGLSPEKILLRWMNYHLREAGSEKRIRNFGGDVKDSEAYTIVMNRISPNDCDTSALNLSDKKKRATKVIENARKLGCRPFVKSRDIYSGNRKLNLAFTADLFNTAPGLDPLEEEALQELEKAGLFGDMEGDDKEELAFRLWANTLGIADPFYLNNLFDDFEDGLNLLKVLDAVEPGLVNWRKVEKKPTMVFKKNSNNSYAVVLGKSLGLRLVSIGGSDITQKNRKLILGFIWQLFRYHSIKFIAQLSKDGVNVDDSYLLNWANEKVQEMGGSPVHSLRDKSIATGHWLIKLVSCIEPEVVDDELVTEGQTEEDQIMNARYAISIARKLDCCIFCLAEDVQEVKPKMILTFVAAVMARFLGGARENTSAVVEEN